MNSELDWQTLIFDARVAVTDHPRFNAWYGGLSAHTQKIVDDILDHNATPEMIYAAQECPEEEYEVNIFIRALAGGNTDPRVAEHLTHYVLHAIASTDLDENKSYRI